MIRPMVVVVFVAALIVTTCAVSMDSETVSFERANQNADSPHLNLAYQKTDGDELNFVGSGAECTGSGVGCIFPDRPVRSQYRGTHNLIVSDGVVDDNSTSSLLEQHIYLAARQQRSVEKDLNFQGDSYTITRIEAYDQQTNSSDSGYVRLFNGGVGDSFVSLKLKSKADKSLKYFVQIWGKVPDSDE